MSEPARKTRALQVVAVLDGAADAMRPGPAGYLRLTEALQHDGDIMVIGQASTAAGTVQLVTETRPDVIVLDLGVDADGGHRVIEQVMARAPTPILVLSEGIEGRQSPKAAAALVAGALDALPLPARWTPESGAMLRRAVRQAGTVRVIRHPRGNLNGFPGRDQATGQAPRPVVALAASTGGPSALAVILAELAGLPAAVLVVQHLRAEFTAGLVHWMSRVSALPVHVAAQGDAALSGHVYFAPGGEHLRLGTDRRLELGTEPACLHRPSANELFESVAQRAGPAAVGVLLTGMGEDGAQGLLSIRQHGGHALAQDEQSCAVFGMPRAAQRLGAVTDLVPLDRLPAAIHQAVGRIRTGRLRS